MIDWSGLLGIAFQALIILICVKAGEHARHLHAAATACPESTTAAANTKEST